MNVMNQSQTSFRTWGRVVCEMEGQLSATTVMLEGCKPPPQANMSCTMSLDLKNVQSYSLFPGQILAVEGTNPSGNKLIVNKMFSSGSTEAPPAFKLQDNIHLVVASGPYTNSDSLDYEPLFELMQHVAETEPHVLILLGPFVPDNHTDIQNSNVLDTFQQLFEELVEKIMKCVKGYVMDEYEIKLGNILLSESNVPLWKIASSLFTDSNSSFLVSANARGSY